MGSRSVIEAAVVALAALALAVVQTYPLATGLGRFGRFDSGDALLSIWNVAWVAQALLTDPRGLFHANIFHPNRYTLAYSEANLGAGVVAVPAYWATRDAVVAHNVVVLFAFTASAAAAYYLLRYLTASRHAAAIGAITFAYCPYIFARLAHIQLLMTAGLPLCLLALHRFVDRPTAARAATLGVSLAGQALFCAYYGIFAGLAVGFGVLFYATSRRLWPSSAYWRGVATAAAIAVLLVFPFFLPYRELQASGFGRTLEDARQYSADWRAYLVSSAWAHRWVLPLLGRWNEVLFPGYVLMTFGAAGLWIGLRSPAPRGQVGEAGPPAGARRAAPVRETATFYGLVALLAGWASFGPDAGLYTLFFHAVPVFSLLRAPARLGIVVVLALSALAAVALARLLASRPPRASLILTGLLAVVAIAELAVFPIGFRQVPPVPAAYRRLAMLPRGAVAEFPFFWIRSDFQRHTRYMFGSTYHWKRLLNGYSDFIPPDFRDFTVRASSFPTMESFELLKQRQTRYVVFHLNWYDHRSREKLLDRLQQYGAYLRLIVRENDIWLYEIVAWPR